MVNDTGGLGAMGWVRKVRHLVYNDDEELHKWLWAITSVSIMVKQTPHWAKYNLLISLLKYQKLCSKEQEGHLEY